MTGEGVGRGVAGAVGAGVALGVGELIAGLVDSVPSPIAAVGRQVVEASPPWLEDFAIATFGTGDKSALALGTVVLALGVGWVVGLLSRGRALLPLVAFTGFGVLGAWAGSGEPGAEPVIVWGASAIAAASGFWLMVLLSRLVPSDDPTAGIPGNRSRRRFLLMAGGTAAAAATVGLWGRRLTTRVPASPPLVIGPVADPAPLPGPQNDFGLPELTLVETPNDRFYRIDTALVTPRVDVSDWRLKVRGMVDHPFELSYDDLLGMDLIETHVTIACVSNEVGAHLIGNARWTGVPLQELLDRAGVQAGADQLVGRSVDGFTAGFPTELAGDGRAALLAVGMNGVALPGAHGYPARLIVPGLYGYVSATKWLEAIELTTWDALDGYWIPRGWAKEAPVKTQSRIDLPRDPVPAGTVTIAGVAWAPLHGIDRVEVRVDQGEWAPCELSVPLSDHSWLQWRIAVPLAPGEYRVAVRATDGTGYTQTDERTPPRPDGATGHHNIRVEVY